MKVSDVIYRARILLSDEDAGSYRWSTEELIEWINDAQRLVAVVRPDSSSDERVVTLAAGTKQTLPADTFRLLDVVRNMASDGVTPGRAVRMVDREILDQVDPDWHKGRQRTEIKHFTYDPRNPGIFFVYPAVSAGVKAEVLLSKYPDAVALETDDLTLPENYFEAVVNYVMFRAYSKDTEFTASPQVASAYLNAFNAVLGVKTQKDNAYSPAVNRKGGAPNAAAMQMGGV